jgi:hypothetical protein
MALKKIAIVNLMGGLGNQLHQIVFSKYLQDQGYSVKIDDTWYDFSKFSDGTTKRELEINVSNFGLETLKQKRKMKTSESSIYKKSKIINKLYNSNINFFYKEHYGNEYNDYKYYFFNIFNGYWQSRKYINESKKFLISGLKKHESFSNVVQNDKTLIHIRKGDYVSWGEDLPLDYFKSSLLNLKKDTDSTEYDIFTDLQEIDQSDSLFNEANTIHNDLSDTGMKTLSTMLSYKNFIISNSSLSYFAAYLGAIKSSVIYYPQPWFKSIKYEPYTKENWSPIEY